MAYRPFLTNLLGLDGTAEAGGLLHSYIRGTTTPRPLYSDAGVTPLTNPVTADALGQITSYFNDALEYSWQAKTADGSTTLWEADVVSGAISLTYINPAYEVHPLFDSSWVVPLANTFSGVRYVANYAALTALPANMLTAGAIFHVAGRVVAGDGGAGPFRVVAGSALTADGGLVLDHDTADFQFDRLLENDCYVAAWWGATATALIAAGAKASQNNFPLFINPGVWAFGATDVLELSGACNVYGAGPSTILRAAVDRTVPVVRVASSGAADNVWVSDLRVESTYSGVPSIGSDGIQANGVDDFTLTNVEVEGKFYIGVVVKDVARYAIENIRVRGAKNRQLYIYENCLDGHVYAVTLDGRDSTDTDYADYCLNINPGGTDTPKRLTVDGVTCRGYTQHGFSIAEAFEEAVISNVVGETATAAAVGFLVQDANARRGRKFQFSNISFKGGLPIHINGSDNWNAVNLMADDADASAGGILIEQCKDWSAANLHAKDGAGNGVQVTGTDANDCIDGVINGVTAEGNAAAGILISSTNANATRRIQVLGINSHNNGTYGAQADAASDEITFDGGQTHTNTTANVLNSSAKGVVRNVRQAGVMPTFTRQVFTSSNTWTRPANCLAVDVEVVGGGGGGGGAAGNSVNAAAAGGGGGGRSIKRILLAALGATETVTIGAGGAAGANTGGDGGTGGTSSFGAHATATGGVGGFGVTAASFVRGGDGGLGASGDANLKGQAGGGGAGCTGLGGLSGSGGGEGGAYGRAIANGGGGAAGADGVNGGGGSGAAEGSTTNRAGGVGGVGYVIVTEYY